MNISTTDAISGCEGDCMTCHPELESSPEHQSLKTCITCHNSEKKSLKIFSSVQVDSGCGTRCFVCHSEWPLDSYHKPLDTCLQCHEK